MQQEAALHFHNDVRQPLGVGPELIRRHFGQRRFRFHRGKSRMRLGGVNRQLPFIL